MNQEIKKLWVEALRSGEYKQTKKRLKDCNGYCCLGVLCDIYKKETGLGEWIKDESLSGYEFITIGHINEKGVLADIVSKWSELNDLNPIIDRVSITVINDSGTYFQEISNLIETYL